MRGEAGFAAPLTHPPSLDFASIGFLGRSVCLETSMGNNHLNVSELM
jgi:hypothetical protein